MPENFQDNYQKRRILNSYFSVVISISIVLFLLGILGLFLLNTKNLVSHFKEQIVMTVFLKDNAKDIEISQMQNMIILHNYMKYMNHNVNYILY